MFIDFHSIVFHLESLAECCYIHTEPNMLKAHYNNDHKADRDDNSERKRAKKLATNSVLPAADTRHWELVQCWVIQQRNAE